MRALLLVGLLAGPSLALDISLNKATQIGWQYLAFFKASDGTITYQMLDDKEWDLLTGTVYWIPENRTGIKGTYFSAQKQPLYDTADGFMREGHFRERNGRIDIYSPKFKRDFLSIPITDFSDTDNLTLKPVRQNRPEKGSDDSPVSVSISGKVLTIQ